MTDAPVSPITGGFSLTGPVNVTLNGGPTPFASMCTTAAPCTLTVAVSGGTLVTYSNLTMTFAGAPTGHFGSQAIHGVVRVARIIRYDDDHHQ